MSIEDEFRDFREQYHQDSKESSEFRGELKQFMLNTTSWVGAVNEKINKHVDSHVTDAKEEKKDEKFLTLDRIGLFITAALAVFGINQGK